MQPANVMVTTEGRVKVLDFGLAKITATEAKDSSDSQMPTDLRTREGVVMGTVPYMSPEQGSGLPVDHRTDIFSLGVLLYEMATGRRPFQGRSSAELVSAILRDAPPAIEQSRPDLPEGLRLAISRCLQKKPEDRFATARETAEALKTLRSGPSSIASMEHAPSAPAAPAPSTGSRSSTLKHAGAAVDVRAFGREVGARYVIEGSLRQAGLVVRIAVRLVDATTGAHLWAETLQPPLRNREDLRHPGRGRPPHRLHRRRLVRHPAAQHERGQAVPPNPAK